MTVNRVQAQKHVAKPYSQSYTCLPASSQSCFVDPALCWLCQDHPLVDDVKVTLDYDLDAPLAAPVSRTNSCIKHLAHN